MLSSSHALGVCTALSLHGLVRILNLVKKRGRLLHTRTGHSGTDAETGLVRVPFRCFEHNPSSQAKDLLDEERDCRQVSLCPSLLSVTRYRQSPVSSGGRPSLLSLAVLCTDCCSPGLPCSDLTMSAARRARSQVSGRQSAVEYPQGAFFGAVLSFSYSAVENRSEKKQAAPFQSLGGFFCFSSWLFPCPSVPETTTPIGEEQLWSACLPLALSSVSSSGVSALLRRQSFSPSRPRRG